MKSYIEEFIGGEVIAVLFTMLGAVFCVLLIACANVTNLQLARALERTKEIAIRSAIGAERWRIVRQLLVEGLLLSLVGAAVGIGIAATGVALFNRAIVDTNPPFWIDIRIDMTVLVFVMALALVSALLSNILPALRVTRASTNDVLKDQGRGSTSLRAGLLSRVLVGGAVTLSCALLHRLRPDDQERRRDRAGRICLRHRRRPDRHAPCSTRPPYATDDAMRGVIERLEQRVAAVSGVRVLRWRRVSPWGGGSYYLTKEGQTFPIAPTDQPTVRRISATRRRTLRSGHREPSPGACWRTAIVPASLPGRRSSRRTSRTSTFRTGDPVGRASGSGAIPRGRGGRSSASCRGWRRPPTATP